VEIIEGENGIALTERIAAESSVKTAAIP